MLMDLLREIDEVRDRAVADVSYDFAAGRYQGVVEARAVVKKAAARVRELEDENQRMWAKLSAIDLVKTWTNEDGKSFVFTDDLLIATGDITPDALSRAREIAEEEAGR